MKRLISGVLLLAMLISLFAGCGNNETAPETTGAPIAQADANLADAVAYVKTVYKEVTEITAADYERIGVVPAGETEYVIEWTVDVSEDLVKIVRNENGMVTIDVNEESEEEVPYVLTATLTGTDGVKESLSWNHILPKAVGDDMGAIVDMAYALEDGQSLTMESTLTGIITSINTAWSDEYQNITVTIQVAGREDKPIMCYRLAGEGAKDLAPGDQITVTGTLKNYKGTIEFDAGCVLDKVVAGVGTVAEGPTDPAEILAEAYALAQGQALPYNSTLTGKIIRIDTKWSSQYKNITVTMVVEGHEDKPIQCYRLKGDGAEDLCVEDTITVNGVLKNYYGTIEFDAGCTLVDVVPGPRTPITFPDQPEDVLQIMQEAYEVTHGHYLPYNVILTGLVTEVNTPWSNKYGNITVTIVMPGAEQYPLVCYRMVGKQYGADTIQVGDTITVHGSVTNYKGTIELAAGCWCYEVVKGEGSGIVNDSQFAKDLEEAALLGEDEKLDRESTITGTITSTPYESSYTKGTYSFWVKDVYGNSVQCYYVPVVGGVPAKGDTVTVTGYLTAYDGRGQFYEDNATATLIDKTEEEPEETTPTEPDPTPDTTLTIPEANELGASKAHDTYTEGKYYVTGTVVEVKDTYYGNMTLKDADGNTLTVYGSFGEDGKTRLEDLANAPKAGDEITVYGIIGQYNDKPQMKNAWIQGAVAAEKEPAKTLNQAQLDEAAALEYGEYLDYESTITGTISDEPSYSEKYKSYSFTVTDGTVSVYCSSLNPAEGYTPEKGDTVTVTGKLTVSWGKPRFDYNSTLTLVKKGEKEPEVTKPATLTEQLAEAAKLTSGDYLDYESTITGTITDTPEFISDYGSYSFTVSDGTDSVYCYSMNVAAGYTPEYGDTVTVTGKLTSFDGKAQFNYKSTVTLVKKVEKEPDDSTTDDTTTGETTVSVSIADYAAANAWANSTRYTSLKVDDYIQVTVNSTKDTGYAPNSGKYYTSGNEWRMYQTEAPNITISADGKTIVSVKITYNVKNDGVLIYGSSQISSGGYFGVNGSSVTFSVGNAGSATNGQVKITAIEVIYK